MRGTIKRYISEKAFGFIATAKGDLFFHLNDVLDLKIQPERGMDVSFDIKQGKKGLQAINIKFVSGQSNNSDNIFVCGNQRFKIWDIKSYGIIDCSQNFRSCVMEGIEEYKKPHSFEEIKKRREKSEYLWNSPYSLLKPPKTTLQQDYEEHLAYYNKALRELKERFLFSDIFKFLYIQTYKDLYVFAKSEKAFERYYTYIDPSKYVEDYNEWYWQDCKRVGIPAGHISEIVYKDLDIDSVIKKLDDMLG